MDNKDMKNTTSRHGSFEPAVRQSAKSHNSAESSETHAKSDAAEKARLERKKRNAKINIAIYVFAAALIVFAGVLLVREFIYFPSQPYSTPLPTINPSDVNATQVLTPLATPVDDYDMIPVKFYFIDKEISCDIYPVGIDDNNVMASRSSAHDVSWLSVEPYVVPGDPGNAIIAGHNLWKGVAGTFSQLKKVEIGEEVAVSFDKGFARYFEVADIYECSYDDPTPMKSTSKEPVLTLITCKGDWDSSMNMSATRIVVVCKLKT